MFRRLLTIHIEFPALDALVAYLRESDKTQAQIDALTAQITTLTQRLKESSQALQQAVEHKP